MNVMIADATPLIWILSWFLAGVSTCAYVIDRIVRVRSQDFFWRIFGTIVAAGLFTLFMMLWFPALFFSWDLCLAQDGCSRI